MAVKTNINGTKKVIELCKNISHLNSFVHVSTSFANCANSSFVKEEVNDPSIEPENMISFAQWISNDMASQITPTLLGSWPNTYTFTKAIAESLVVKECENKIKCSIVRPSILGASSENGWLNSFNQSSFVLAAAGKNNTVKRIMYGDMESNVDVIPVDYAVNMILVAG